MQLDAPAEWDRVLLKELGEVNRGRSRHRPRHAPHLYGGPYPFVQTGDIKASRGRITQHTQTYSEAGLAQSRLWPAGTMAITIAANIAETAILTYPACFPDSVIGFIADPSKCDVWFIEYMFRLLRRHIQHVASDSGTVQDNINLAFLDNMRFPVPRQVSEQRAIARRLRVLDDKIELNRRMNQTLEALARAVFKSWFVDFDPVTAEAAGRKTIGMSAATADLFPRKFIDSAVGPIPAGWRIGCFGDIAVNVRAGAAPSEISTATPYIALEHMPRKSIALDDWTVGDGVMSQKFKFTASDILFGKLRPYFHKVGAAPIDGVCSTDILVIRAKEPRWAGLALEHAASDEMVQYADATSGGTKMPRTNWHDLARFEIVVPEKPVAEAFTKIVAACTARIISSIHQSKTLAALRDALLPRLMSGELRVSQAEVITEDTIAESPVADSVEHSVGTIAVPFEAKKRRATSDEFKEAVLIAALVRGLSSEMYPLGRKRYNKFAYMVHRKAEHDVQQKYLKKAAGPYSPWARYQGPENIAVKNGYVKRAIVGKLAGLAVGQKIADIDKYLPNYGVTDALNWAVKTLRWEKNDELELLTTVDFAALELLGAGKAVSVSAVKEIIGANPDWAPKLDRAIFSDIGIARALQRLKAIFPGSYD